MPDHKHGQGQGRAQEPGQRQAPRRGWAAQAGVFLAVAFVAAGLCGALQPATGLPPEVLQLTQFGPALAVAAVALLWPGRIRYRLAGTLPARGSGPAGRQRRTAAADSRAALLLTPVLITALSAGGILLVSGSLPVTSPRALAHPLALLVTAQLLGACAEEIGWRCYLQPLLRTRFGPVTSSVLVGTVWGLWHVPVLAQEPAYAAGFLAATIAMSVILGLALERVRSNRLLLAGGFHTLVNLGMLFVTDETSPAAAPMLVLGAACLAAALPWIASARRPATAPDRITAATAHGAR
ncbi:CPBP family intramembrane metalloprotease [Streptomyces sp. NBC_01310]|uniref:CPBP family intramembrane glutamic endopeptidase n=1 Tax=Streptomyces sp. NBC_01310 TaxID=2903820 RepID=UPI0035B57BC1|nr:CPBP family intramembrane metalloprotease [Streptomyces sp. NBC_01310]WSJ63744.1 CPBP family intramembrane metalloprotease [Streptomyces sp. NBC_01310]